MQVKIKLFDVQMDVKANGIEFEVRTANGKEQLGDCYLAMKGLVWCEGRTTRKKGVQINWKDFMAIMASEGIKKTAIRAAKQA